MSCFPRLVALEARVLLQRSRGTANFATWWDRYSPERRRIEAVLNEGHLYDWRMWVCPSISVSRMDDSALKLALVR